MDAIRLVDRLDNSSDDEVVQPRTIKQRANYFDSFNEVEFAARFRLRKQTVLEVLKLIEGSLEKIITVHTFIPEIQLKDNMVCGSEDFLC